MSSEPKPDADQSRRSLELGRMVAEGATALLGGEFLSKLVGVIGSIFLIRLLVSPQIYAPIAAATTLPGLVMLGDLTGVNAALTRTLSLSKRERNAQTIWSSYWVALSIKLGTGVLLSLVAFFLASPISILLGKSSISGYLLIASSLPIVWTTQVNIKSTLLALGYPRAYAWLQIVNEVLLSFAPIPAVLLGFGAMGALVAMVLANFAYLAIGLIVSSAAVFSETSSGNRKITYLSTARSLVKFGLPLGLSSSSSSFFGQINNFIILRFVSLYAYGLFSVAGSAYSLMNSITDPLNSMTYPVYSRIKGSQETGVLQTVYKQSVRYSTLIILPIALFFIIFGGPFLTLFFGTGYTGGGIYVSAMSIGALTIGMGWTSNVLTSQGFSKYTGGLGILTSFLVTVLTIIVVPTLGLLAYILLSNLAFMPSYVLLVKRAKSDLSISPPYSYVKPFYGALLISGLVSFPLILVNLPPLVEVIAGALVVSTSFLFFSILFHGLKPSDPVHLRNIISSQPKVSKVVNPVIRILAKTIRFVNREK